MIITLGANGITSLLGLLSGILGARILGPQGRGELAAIQMWGLFLSTFALLGMPDALVYFTARESKRTASYVISAILLALVGGIPLLCLAYQLIPFLLSAQNPSVIAEARFYLLVGVTSMLGQVPFNALRGLSEFALWNTLRVVGTVLSVVPLLLAWFFDRRTAEFVATMNLFLWGALYNVIVILAVVRRIPGPYRLEVQDWKPMLSFGLPCMATVLPQSLNFRLDQMLMAAVFAPRLLGLYVVAVAWAGIMMPLFQAIAIVLFPQVASAPTRIGQTAIFTRVLRFGIPLAVLEGVVLALVTPRILPLAFGYRYVGSIPAAVVLVFAGAVLGINQILGEGLRGLGMPTAVLWAELGGLVSTVIFLALLLKPLGIVGAAIASLIGYGTVATLLMLWARELTGCPLTRMSFPTHSELDDIVNRLRAWFRGLRGAAAQ